MKAWGEGKMSTFGKNYAREGKISYKRFVSLYKPAKYNALYVFFTQFPPREDEYLFGYGDLPYGKHRGWFVITDKRLVQRDGPDNTFREVLFSEVVDFEYKLEAEVPLIFKMKSGEKVQFENLKLLPLKEYLTEAIKQNQ
jgi:hypothetical protein